MKIKATGHVVMLMLIMLLAAGLQPLSAQAAPAEVISATVNVRAGAGTEYEVVGQLAQGALVEVVGSDAGWAQITGAVSGWIRADLLREKGPDYVEVTGNSVNLRAQPTTEAEIVSQVRAGDKIQIVERLENWYRVRTLSGREVYIAADLVREVYYQPPSVSAEPEKTGNKPAETAASQPAATAAALDSPQVFLEGKPLVFTDVAPMIKNGRTLVPLRFIFEAVGAQVAWDQATQEVTATRGTDVVKLRIAATDASINGSTVALDVPAQIVNDRTLAPLRFVGEAFGGKVGWEADTRSIYISMPLTEVPAAPAPAPGALMPNQVQVVASTVNIRNLPSEQGDILGQVSRGEVMPVLTQQAGWYQIRHQGLSGWVAGEMVLAWEASEPIPDPALDNHTAIEPPAATLPSLTGDVIHVGFRADDKGVGLIISSGRQLDFTVEKKPGHLEYLITGVNFLTPADLTQDLGESGAVRVTGRNVGNDARVTIDLPVEVQYEENSGNNGKEHILYIPNRIIGVSRSLYADRGDKIIITTLRPLEYSYEVANDGCAVEVKLKNVVLGSGRENYDYIGKVLASMNIQSLTESDGSNSLLLRIGTKQACKFNFVAEANVLNIVATVKTQESYAGSNVVVLDAGHGGTDSGAHREGIQEKNVVLPITLRAGAILQSRGFQVIYTRTDDSTVELDARSQIANQHSAALFVSVHANANVKSEPNGTETYFYAPLDKPDLFQQRMERERLATLLQQEVVGRLHRADRGVKEANFSVLRKTSMPSALVETAFISNAEERGLLNQDYFQQQAAEGIAEGIIKYMQQYQR